MNIPLSVQLEKTTRSFIDRNSICQRSYQPSRGSARSAGGVKNGDDLSRISPRAVTDPDRSRWNSPSEESSREKTLPVCGRGFVSRCFRCVSAGSHTSLRPNGVRRCNNWANNRSDANENSLTVSSAAPADMIVCIRGIVYLRILMLAFCFPFFFTSYVAASLIN